MPADLVWSPQAREDLIEIYTAIGLASPTAAERYYDLLEAKAARLIDHPRLGVRRPEIRPSVRMLVEATFVLLYEIVPDTDDGPVRFVEVVRVIDGRRDLTTLF